MNKLLWAALLAGLLVLPVIALAGPYQQQGTFQAPFVGVYTNKDDLTFSTVVTGTTGFALVNGKTAMGNYVGYMVYTGEATTKECTSADGAKGTERVAKEEAWIISFSEQADQLFLQLNKTKPAVMCQVAGVGTVGNVPLDVTGGTGRFKGATGSVVKSFKSAPFLQPASLLSKGYFVSFAGSLDGNIVLAKTSTQ